MPLRPGGTVAFTRHEGGVSVGTAKTNGKLDYTFTRTVSADGATLTIEMQKTDASGKPFMDVLVYDRVR